MNVGSGYIRSANGTHICVPYEFYRTTGVIARAFTPVAIRIFAAKGGAVQSTAGKRIPRPVCELVSE